MKTLMTKSHSSITSFEASTTPSLASSQDFEDEGSISDCSTVAMSNVTKTHEEDKMSTFRLPGIPALSSWTSTFFCGSFQLVYYVND